MPVTLYLYVFYFKKGKLSVEQGWQWQHHSSSDTVYVDTRFCHALLTQAVCSRL